MGHLVSGNSIDLLWAISITTAVLLFLSVSIITILIYSKRKEIAAQVKQQTILDSINELIYSTEQIFPDSQQAVVSFVSSRSERGIGIDPDEFVQDPNRWFSLVHPDDKSSISEQTSKIFKSKQSGSRIYRVLNKQTGNYMWVEDVVFPKLDEKGRVVATFGVIRDITERKVSQEKILEQAILLDEAQDAIMVTDFEGRITFWNNGAELIYGRRREQAVGSFIRTLIFDTAHSKDYDLAMEDMLQFNEWSGEQYHLNNIGKELLIQSRWKKVESTSTNKKVILIVNTDITEKKRQEIQLLRAQRMESIALLTGGIAHDLQNVLAPVSMSIGLLREKLTDGPSMRVLDAVEESARSGLDLIRNIITYGHGIPGERAKVELSELLDSILTIVRQSLPDTIRIEKLTGGKNYTVSGDVNQLKQVFLNIVVNARDAMPNGGMMTIRIDKVTIDENCLDQYPEAQIGKYHLVNIGDNGSGISEDCIERIFEPFFTTKTNGNGTGLGLSIALGIVKSHSGYITVHSVVDQGTEFKIFLPALES
jgi:two-component system cell cycle sensor histidine kinase/response regulator CckA